MTLRRLLPAVLLAGALGGLILLERSRPLRRTVEPPNRRDARNLCVAAVSAVALRLSEQPLVGPLAALVERRRWGLLQRLALPRWAERAAALALLDYTLYLWHVLTHRLPLLWRFHRVHHLDRDLSASTALRFHFVELMLSVPWRAAQVALIGVRPSDLALWQKLTLLSILFHHSNLRLPIGLERGLVRLLVTPRMHGIHHSTRAEETASNWSSGLSLWDRLHGTLRLDVWQPGIEIGAPDAPGGGPLTLGRVLALPLRG